MQAVHEALTRLKAQLVDKRVLFKPFITDFDKVNCGQHSFCHARTHHSHANTQTHTHRHTRTHTRTPVQAT